MAPTHLQFSNRGEIKGYIFNVVHIYIYIFFYPPVNERAVRAVPKSEIILLDLEN